MSSQDLVDFYVEKIKSSTDAGEISIFIQQSLEDRQLFLYGEILHTLRNHSVKVGNDVENVLEMLAFGEYQQAPDDVKNHLIVAEKLRILTVMSAVQEIGLEVPLAHLQLRLEFPNIADLFSLLLRMSQSQLVEIAIDERGGIVTFTSIHLFREVPKSISNEYICDELLKIAERVSSTPLTLPEEILQCNKMLIACRDKPVGFAKQDPGELPKKTPSKRTRQHTSTY